MRPACLLALACALRPLAAHGFEDAEHLLIAQRAFQLICRSPEKLPGLASSVCSGSAPATEVLESFAEYAALVRHSDDNPFKLMILETERESRFRLSLAQGTLGSLFGFDDSARHYYPGALHEYQRWHALARQTARFGKNCAQSTSSDQCLSSFHDALLFEAFAVHYLADTYSAGRGNLQPAEQHAAVQNRNRARFDSGGRLAVSGNLYFGDGNLGKAEAAPQLQEIIDQTEQSLLLVLCEFDAKAGDCRGGEVAAPPFFGWQRADIGDVIDRETAEKWSLGLAVRADRIFKSGRLGLRGALPFGRYLQLSAAALPFFTESGRFSTTNTLLQIGPGLRMPIAAIRSPVASLDFDLAAEAQWSFEVGGVGWRGVPEWSAGIDLYWRPLSTATWSVVYGLRAGQVWTMSGQYSFAPSSFIGIAR